MEIFYFIQYQHFVIISKIKCQYTLETSKQFLYLQPLTTNKHWGDTQAANEGRL